MVDHPEMKEHMGKLDVLRPEVRTRIEKVRNSVEHMDERVRNLKVTVGDFSALWMGEDGIELENSSISYIELAHWLTEFHALADRLADHGAH